MNNLILSIFPRIDLLGRAFEEEGFCVVRGPDLLWGGDIRTFHPPSGVFDGVIGGPPCQDFSSGNLYRSDKLTYGKQMLCEASRVIAEASPLWWLIENVPAVPDIILDGYYIQRIVLNARWVGNPQNRLRHFQFASKNKVTLSLDICMFENQEYTTCVVASEMEKGYRPKGFRGPYVPARLWPQLCRLMGLPKDFDLPPFKKAAKGRAIGEGVPIDVGRCWAKAIKEITGDNN